MSTPALALAPALIDGAGTGANAGTTWPRCHRHHASRENADGKRESGDLGRFAAYPWPGAPRFPLSSAIPRQRPHASCV
jgi:hypothetical protein